VALAPTHTRVVQDRDGELVSRWRAWNQSVRLAEHLGALDQLGATSED
jgi:hypothetical protein